MLENLYVGTGVLDDPVCWWAVREAGLYIEKLTCFITF